MNGKIWGYFEIAGKLAKSRDDKRSFLLGAVGIRRDGAMVSAVNSISQEPNRLLHAEYRLHSRLDYGSTVYVARVRLLNGEFAMAKPCESCQKALSSKKVKKVFYTIDNDEYGVLDLQ